MTKLLRFGLTLGLLLFTGSAQGESLFTGALLFGQPAPRPDSWIPASKVSVTGLVSTNLQTAIDEGELSGGGGGGGDSILIDSNTVVGSVNFLTGDGLQWTWVDGSPDTATLSFQYGNTLTSNALVSKRCVFSNTGAYGGILCEGLTADSNEMFLQFTVSGASGGDVTVNIPGTAAGTHSVCLSTDGGATLCTGYASGTAGVATQAASVSANAVALGTGTTGGYAASSTEGGLATEATSARALAGSGGSGSVTMGGIAYTLPLDDGDVSEILQTDGSGVLTWVENTGGGGGGGFTLFAGNCETQTGVLNDTCVDTGTAGVNNQWTVWICATATCSGAGWTWVGGKTFNGVGSPNGSAPGNCTAGTGGSCACNSAWRDYYIDTTTPGSPLVYVCESPSTDVWRTVITLTINSNPGDPNTAPRDCRFGGSELYVDLDTSQMYYCDDAVTNHWSGINPAGARSLLLRVDETPSEFRIPAFGSADANDIVVGDCSYNATLDGIDCDAGTAGQAQTLKEASANGSNSLSLEAPDAITTSKRFVAGTGTSRFPKDALEDNARICATGVADLQFQTVWPPFSRDMKAVDMWSRCVGSTQTNDSDDCSGFSGAVINVYSCPTGTNNDIPQNCTKRGHGTYGTEWGSASSFAIDNTGIAPAGDSIYIDADATSMITNSHTVCFTFESTQP